MSEDSVRGGGRERERDSFVIRKGDKEIKGEK